MTHDGLDEQIRVLAGDACEYCRLPQKTSQLRFVLDHVIARRHGGQRALQNLALACGRCNRHKGPNISGIDPQTQGMTRLFHPRQDVWSEHFRWDEVSLVALTPIGRATIAVLAINDPSQIRVRQVLRQELE
jgi:hypothetical protein